MSATPLVLTASKAIRAKCLDCSGVSDRETKLCQVTDCPLWPWRLGRPPKSVRRKAPDLLEPAYVILAGCMLDFEGDYLAHQTMADPRSLKHRGLSGYSDEELAGIADRLKSTPRSAWIPGVSGSINPGLVDPDKRPHLFQKRPSSDSQHQEAGAADSQHQKGGVA